MTGANERMADTMKSAYYTRWRDAKGNLEELQAAVAWVFDNPKVQFMRDDINDYVAVSNRHNNHLRYTVERIEGESTEAFLLRAFRTRNWTDV